MLSPHVVGTCSLGTTVNAMEKSRLVRPPMTFRRTCSDRCIYNLFSLRFSLTTHSTASSSVLSDLTQHTTWRQRWNMVRLARRCMLVVLSNLTKLHSSPRQLWTQGVQNHLGGYVLRRPPLAGVGSGRGGGHPANPVRVRLPGRAFLSVKYLCGVVQL